MSKQISKLKKKGVGYWKKKAWEQFSLYIRLKYAKDGICQCITCGKEYPAAGTGMMQAGHAFKGRKNAYLFDERIVFPQCRDCNYSLDGCEEEYTMKMIEKYGLEEWKQIRQIKHQMKKFTEEELQEKITYYKQKVKELENT